MTKGESAKENFMSGLNCSQAVAAAFAEEMNMPKSLVEKLTVGFGGTETCVIIRRRNGQNERGLRSRFRYDLRYLCTL